MTILSPFSESAVALANGGYGTFDMKNYDVNTYQQVMSATTDNSVYWKYYICDFTFTLVFFNFMIQIVSGFSGKTINKIKKVSYGIAFVRGCLDITENIILLKLIYGYPYSNTDTIGICNIITRAKFNFMWIWIFCFVVLVIISILKKKLWSVKSVYNQILIRNGNLHS